MRIRSASISTMTLCLALAGLSCSEPEPIPYPFQDPKAPLERRLKDLMQRLQPGEKLALIRGERNDRLGIPALTTVAGVMGISARDASGRPIPATAFPANTGMAATWNPELLSQTGAVIAQQARALGRGRILGPLTDINRSPLSGRTFETYGEDPWLTSRLVDGYIAGVQGEGEIATAIFDGGASGSRAAREFDLRPLEAAVTEAGVWAVMPRAGHLPGDFLQELGFRGFTDTADVPAAVDDQARGVLRAMFASGVFDRDVKTQAAPETPAHRAVAREAAARSIVLLKNEGDLLPLDPGKLHTVAVIGPNAAVNRMASGSYTVAARYSNPPLDALRAIFGARLSTAASQAADADVAIVFAGTGAETEGETVDRASLDLPAGQDELIESTARANPRTIVVLTTGSAVAMDRWIHDVPAVLEAWFPGEEGGNAIADALTGVVNPSGRLPIAFPSRAEDFPFGFGLSYARFEYRDLAVMPAEVSPGQFVEVSLTVTNTGTRAGRETVQLYLHEISSAAGIRRNERDLRAFRQVDLKPDESARVRFTLTPAATSCFDEKRHDWVQDQAVFEVRVGSSSRDIRAVGTLSVGE